MLADFYIMNICITTDACGREQTESQMEEPNRFGTEANSNGGAGLHSINPTYKNIRAVRIIRPGLWVAPEKRGEIWQEVAGQRLQLHCRRSEGGWIQTSTDPRSSYSHYFS